MDSLIDQLIAIVEEATKELDAITECATLDDVECKYPIPTTIFNREWFGEHVFKGYLISVFEGNMPAAHHYRNAMSEYYVESKTYNPDGYTEIYDHPKLGSMCHMLVRSSCTYNAYFEICSGDCNQRALSHNHYEKELDSKIKHIQRQPNDNRKHQWIAVENKISKLYREAHQRLTDKHEWLREKNQRLKALLLYDHKSDKGIEEHTVDVRSIMTHLMYPIVCYHIDQPMFRKCYGAINAFIANPEQVESEDYWGSIIVRILDDVEQAIRQVTNDIASVYAHKYFLNLMFAYHTLHEEKLTDEYVIDPSSKYWEYIEEHKKQLAINNQKWQAYKLAHDPLALKDAEIASLKKQLATAIAERDFDRDQILKLLKQ